MHQAALKKKKNQSCELLLVFVLLYIRNEHKANFCVV